MLAKLLLTTLLSLVMFCFGTSQEDVESGFYGQLETIFQDDETDLMPIIDHLNGIAQKPIDLNRCGFEELSDLAFLSTLQIENILKHRDILGDFLDVHELQSVSGIDINTVVFLSNFVSVEPKKKWTPVTLYNLTRLAKSDVILRAKTILEEKANYTRDENNEKKFLGNNHQYLLRYRYNFDNRILFNYLGEKDPGETLYKPDLAFGPDFNSAYLSILGVNRLPDLVILGDFHIHMGQGLISNASYGGGKSGSVMQINKMGRSVRPNGSINESGFLRGSAVSGKWKKWNYTGFASYRKLNANLGFDPQSADSSDFRIRSVNITGFHRNEKELAIKNNTTLITFGSKLGFQQKKYRIGFNFMGNKYQYHGMSPEDIYQKYKSTDPLILNYSMDYSFRWKNMFFSGETAAMDFSAIANVHMIQMSIARNFDLALLYRNYPVNYHAPFAGAFGESSGTNNERGLYIGGVVRINRHVHIETYMDFWKYNWLKYLVDRPSQGFEYFCKAEYNIRKRMSLYFQFKKEIKERNLSTIPSSTKDLGTISRTSYRAHVNYKLNAALELRNRVEWIQSTSESKSYGILIFQDIVYKPVQLPVSFTARLAYFDIPDWDSRIYAYENDLLYAFSIPVYYRSGYRIYLNTRYKPIKDLVVEARIARSYSPFDVIMEEENLPHKTELKVQIKYSF